METKYLNREEEREEGEKRERVREGGIKGSRESEKEEPSCLVRM